MRHTSGIIINDDIFINSSHVVKIEKTKKADSEYTINIHLLTIATPMVISFDNESKCNEVFKRIIQEMYGFDYSIVRK